MHFFLILKGGFKKVPLIVVVWDFIFPVVNLKDSINHTGFVLADKNVSTFYY